MLEDSQIIEVAVLVIALMFCVWLFIAPIQSEEPRRPEDDADDQTFSM